jgi:hypothetical protein
MPDQALPPEAMQQVQPEGVQNPRIKKALIDPDEGFFPTWRFS